MSFTEDMARLLAVTRANEALYATKANVTSSIEGREPSMHVKGDESLVEGSDQDGVPTVSLTIQPFGIEVHGYVVSRDGKDRVASLYSPENDLYLGVFYEENSIGSPSTKAHVAVVVEAAKEHSARVLTIREVLRSFKAMASQGKADSILTIRLLDEAAHAPVGDLPGVIRKCSQ